MEQLGKMFLLGDSLFRVRKDGDNQVAGQIQELTRVYPDLDVSTLARVNYEPERANPMHTYRLISDGPTEPPRIGPMPFAPYEALFENFDLLQTRLADPFFGLTLEEAAILQAKLDADAAFATQHAAAELLIKASAIKDWTFQELEDHVNTVFSGLAANQRNFLVTLSQLVLALVKREFREGN